MQAYSKSVVLQRMSMRSVDEGRVRVRRLERAQVAVDLLVSNARAVARVLAHVGHARRARDAAAHAEHTHVKHARSNTPTPIIPHDQIALITCS